MNRKIRSFENLKTIMQIDVKYSYKYLILDAAQVSEKTLLFINACRSDTRIEIYSLFAGTTEGNAPFEVSPILIFLNDLTILLDEKFNFIEEIWENEQALNLIDSHLDLKNFIKKMKKYLTVYFPDGSQKIFRWFDPRILKKIDKILDKEQQYEFFKDIEKWLISIRNYRDINSNQIMQLENI